MVRRGGRSEGGQQKEECTSIVTACSSVLHISTSSTNDHVTSQRTTNTATCYSHVIPPLKKQQSLMMQTSSCLILK